MNFIVNMIHKYLIIIVLFAMCSCGQQVPENSQWRGENRDGVYNETGLLKEWAAEGPELLWAYEGLGEGFTSAAIANGKIYITGLDVDRLVLFVFDLNGQLLHRKDVANERDEEQEYAGPRSTINVNEGKLYIYNSFGKLVCLDENTLEEVWTREIFADFGGRNTPWGVNESPLIVGEKLFITPGGDENNIVALDKTTGELIWSSPGEGTRHAYCSPQFIGDQSLQMIVTSTFDYIIALNADTGEKLWSHPHSSGHDIHPNTPLYHDGMILSLIGWGGGALMLRLTDGGKAVEEVWKNREIDTRIGGAVKIGDYFYASGDNNRFWFCVDWNSGEIMYRVRDLALCNVIAADGMLYCYSERGSMYLVRPNPEEFEIASSFPITLGTQFHFAHPVIHNGVLYIRHGDALMAYKIK